MVKIVVEGQEHGPIEVAILAAFLFYRYKFLSRAKDKNLYRLPRWTRTYSHCRLGAYPIRYFVRKFIKQTGRIPPTKACLFLDIKNVAINDSRWSFVG